MESVMIVVVVVMVEMYILGKLNLCWFRSRTHILMMTVFRYVIAGPLQVLPTQLLTTALRKL